MTITANRDKVRIRIGDTDSTDPLLFDDEIDSILSDEGEDINKAAVVACESIAAKFSRAYDFATDGQSFNRSQIAKTYAQLAEQLRIRFGVETDPTTRVDGYSDDIAYDETNASPSTGGGRVREGYFNPDLPF